MTVETTGTNEIVPTTTTPDSSAQTTTPTGTTEPSAAITTPSVATGTDAPPTPPAYTPNYKFKVKDKELEFDDWAKTAAKDADTEKKIRETFEKAHGIEVVKADRETLKTQLTQAQEYISTTDADLNRLGTMVREGDFDTFFAELKIPEDKILQYAIQLAERKQWTPDQQRAWQESRDAKTRASFFETRAQQLEADNQRVEIQQRQFELNSVMSRPDISPVVQAYNQGMANPLAFQELVLEIGNAAWATRKEDLSADQAVQRALKYIRGANPNLGQASPQSTIVTPSNKPVIPNIQGRGTSPVKPAIKSLDDIKKLTRERESQGV